VALRSETTCEGLALETTIQCAVRELRVARLVFNAARTDDCQHMNSKGKQCASH
jgi:hypothetical protein